MKGKVKITAEAVIEYEDSDSVTKEELQTAAESSSDILDDFISNGKFTYEVIEVLEEDEIEDGDEDEDE